MPSLKNSKHERFCLELASGKTANEAYVLAGYEENDGNACRLKGNERIIDRLSEIQGEISAAVVEQVAMSKEEVLNELAKIARAYVSPVNIRPSDKQIACMNYARLKGWIIDKVEHGEAGEFEKIKSMNGTELRDFLAKRSEARRLRGTPSADGGGTRQLGKVAD